MRCVTFDVTSLLQILLHGKREAVMKWHQSPCYRPTQNGWWSTQSGWRVSGASTWTSCNPNVAIRYTVHEFDLSRWAAETPYNMTTWLCMLPPPPPRGVGNNTHYVMIKVHTTQVTYVASWHPPPVVQCPSQPVLLPWITALTSRGCGTLPKAHRVPVHVTIWKWTPWLHSSTCYLLVWP